MNMSKRSQLWILALAGLVCAQAIASLFPRQGFALVALSDITQFILLFAGTISMLPNVLTTRGRIRLFWALMMLGMAFWTSYPGLWMYFEALLRKDFPNPFGGDGVLFLHLVSM